MKKLLLLLLSFLFTSCFAIAQENKINNGLGFGFQLNQFQKDFGFGLSFTSPHFIHEKVSVRLKGNRMFYEHAAKDEITWTPYYNVSLGLTGVGGYVTEKIRLYGEGGLIMLFPSPEFSTQKTATGGYGLFGFEFFMRKGHTYFIELGGVGTGARADKINLKPIYSNGFMVSTGYRVYLP